MSGCTLRAAAAIVDLLDHRIDDLAVGLFRRLLGIDAHGDDVEILADRGLQGLQAPGDLAEDLRAE